MPTIDGGKQAGGMKLASCPQCGAVKWTPYGEAVACDVCAGLHAPSVPDAPAEAEAGTVTMYRRSEQSGKVEATLLKRKTE